MKPPTVSLIFLQAELQHPQQTHGQQLGLGRPQDRLLGPRSAFLPAQPLLQVPETIFLPETGSDKSQEMHCIVSRYSLVEFAHKKNFLNHFFTGLK